MSDEADHEDRSSSDSKGETPDTGTSRFIEVFVDADDEAWQRVENEAGNDSEEVRLLSEVACIRSAFRQSSVDALSESARIRRERRELAESVDDSHENLDDTDDTDTPHAARKNGARLPGYEIIGEIGEGGFAKIYRARDIRSERHVAVKLLRRRLGIRPESVARFLREARALARMNQPNIVRIYHVIEEEDLLGLSMELIDGETLKQVLERSGPLPAEQVASIGIDLSRALGAVHDEGFVHRDIKVENVMRERGGRIVLMDFGLTRSFDTDSKLTGTGILVGTPLAMAPEQYEFKEVDGRTDIYSLGTLLYRLATGKYHVEGDTMQEIRNKVLAGEHVPIESLQPKFSPDLARIITRCMATDPKRRYANTKKLEGELLTWLGLAQGESGAGGGHPRSPYPRSVVLLLSVILAVLLGILAFLIYLTFS